MGGRYTAQEPVRVERWRDVPGYVGKYHASTEGNIQRKLPNGTMAPVTIYDNRGYRKNYCTMILTRPDGRWQERPVLRVVAETWFPAAQDRRAAQRNGLKSDNSVWNVALMTRKAIGQHYARAHAVIRHRSSDSKRLDGLNPHGAIFDEIHEYRDFKLLNIIKKKTVKRDQPLIMYITTMGSVLDGPRLLLRPVHRRAAGTSRPRRFRQNVRLHRRDGRHRRHRGFPPVDQGESLHRLHIEAGNTGGGLEALQADPQRAGQLYL